MEGKISSLKELTEYLESDSVKNNLLDEEDEIISRYDFLKRNGLSHLKSDDIQIWLNNFEDNPSHRFIALFILQSITYRNYEMMEISFTRKIAKDIKNIYETVSNRKIDDIEEWLKVIRNASTDEENSSIAVNFYSINKEAGNLTQSSNTILRKLTSKTVDQSRILDNITSVKENIKNNNMVIFIDDFLGSGLQATNFFINNNLISLLEELSLDVPLVYMPLMAMPKGIEKLAQDAPNIIVLPCELIGDNSRLSQHYSLESYLKAFDIKFDQIDIESLFREMRKYYNFIDRNIWLGWKKAMLSIVFNWGCPNQTVPIIYHSRNIPTSDSINNNTFNPLAFRRDV